MAEFSEKFQTAFDPSPHFRKIILQFFSEIHDQSIVYNGKNLQHKFLDWKWPPTPFGTFSENSSVLEGVGFPKGEPGSEDVSPQDQTFTPF